ncbi:MAG: hypothetical protein RMH75_03330 [Archaeoglobaceae archaeon]|nr:hypothetical protein [Archaeoglobaceae archaeon]
MNGRIVYIASKLACIEKLKTGTTFFLDMYFSLQLQQKLLKKQGLEHVYHQLSLTFLMMEFWKKI